MAGKKEMADKIPDTYVRDECNDFDELCVTLESLLKPTTRNHGLLDKVSVFPPHDPCLDHSPVVGYLLFEMLTQRQQKKASEELLKYASASGRQFISVKPGFCKENKSCSGHYGCFYYEDDCVHSEDTANVLLNMLPKNLNGVYVYFLRRGL